MIAFLSFAGVNLLRYDTPLRGSDGMARDGTHLHRIVLGVERGFGGLSVACFTFPLMIPHISHQHTLSI